MQAALRELTPNLVMLLEGVLAFHEPQARAARTAPVA
jgi:hypothetical protein